jgi:hypothetical protein
MFAMDQYCGVLRQCAENKVLDEVDGKETLPDAALSVKNQV